LVAVAILGVALTGLPAGGHEVINRDPDDTQGQFDIRWTKMDRTQTKVILKMKVTGELQKSDFTGGNYFQWGLDTEPESRTAPLQVNPADYWVYLESRMRNGRRVMRCIVFDEEGRVGGVADDLGTHVGTCPIRKDLIKGPPPPDGFNGFTIFNGHTDVNNLKIH
jgi:hypothetical protein